MILFIGLASASYCLFIGLQIGYGISFLLFKCGYLPEFDPNVKSDEVPSMDSRKPSNSASTAKTQTTDIEASVPKDEKDEEGAEGGTEIDDEVPPIPPMEVKGPKTEIETQPRLKLSLKDLEIDQMLRVCAIVIECLFVLPLFILLSVFVNQHGLRPVWLACCFGPFGTFIRYELSLWQQPSNRYPKLPIFTLLVNVAGSCLDFGLTQVHAEGLGLDIIDAVNLGFCGCLTTVSTFVNEIRLLSTNFSKYIYVFLSIGITQLLLAVIFGLSVL